MPKPDVQEYLEGLGRFGMHLGLGRVRRLLAGLGDPQLAYPAVHVAGTNGKGSVCKMLACILQEAGYRTGLYMSPHLERFNERISVDGTDIADRELEELVPRVRAQVDKMARKGKGQQCTYFEATTAVAFEHFHRADVEVAVIEVGLGGRLDATNVVDPLLSVITNISLEHTEVLGRTVQKVAMEKAGIIKPERPMVTGAWDRKAVDVISRTAAKNRAPFHMMQREVRRRPLFSDLKGQRFSVYTDREDYRELFIPMLGGFQLDNASLAVLSSELLAEEGLQIGVENIRRGLARARLPGRLELVRARPDVLLDCAHNPEAAQRTATDLGALKKEAGWERVHLLFGILSDKALPDVLGPLVRQADTLTFTQPSTDRALAVEKAQKAVSALTGDKGLSIISRPENALHSVLKLAGKNDLAWVAGSMYLVGEVRGLLKKRHILAA